MKVTTTDLIGLALDWAVAKCKQEDEGYVLTPDQFRLLHNGRNSGLYCYSSNWALGGPIIESEAITLDWAHLMKWEARLYVPDQEPWVMTGPSPLVAALRCFVASKLGDEVDVPEDMIGDGDVIGSDGDGNLICWDADKGQTYNSGDRQ